MHCVDTGHDTWGDQDNKEEEGGDEVHDWEEGNKVKFSMRFEDEGGTEKYRGIRLHSVSFIRDNVKLRLEASKEASLTNC